MGPEKAPKLPGSRGGGVKESFLEAGFCPKSPRMRQEYLDTTPGRAEGLALFQPDLEGER